MTPRAAAGRAPADAGVRITAGRPSPEAIARAGEIFQAGFERMMTLPPRVAAEEAYVPGGKSVDELEDRIRSYRGLPPLHADGAA